MSTNIPEARRLLLQVLSLGTMTPDVREDIQAALALMTRPPHSERRIAPIRAKKVTPEMAEGMRVIAGTTNMSQQAIAVAYGVTQARVSEVLNGKRDFT